jgi:hypothetical protein
MAWSIRSRSAVRVRISSSRVAFSMKEIYLCCGLNTTASLTAWVRGLTSNYQNARDAFGRSLRER